MFEPTLLLRGAPWTAGGSRPEKPSCPEALAGGARWEQSCDANSWWAPNTVPGVLSQSRSLKQEIWALRCHGHHSAPLALHQADVFPHTGSGSRSTWGENLQQGGSRKTSQSPSWELTLRPQRVFILSLLHYSYRIFPYPQLLAELIVCTFNSLCLPITPHAVTVRQDGNTRRPPHFWMCSAPVHGETAAPIAPSARVNNYRQCGHSSLPHGPCTHETGSSLAVALPCGPMGLLLCPPPRACLLGAWKLQFPRVREVGMVNAKSFRGTLGFMESKATYVSTP